MQTAPQVLASQPVASKEMYLPTWGTTPLIGECMIGMTVMDGKGSEPYQVLSQVRFIGT